jgi:hypothetical protein
MHLAYSVHLCVSCNFHNQILLFPKQQYTVGFVSKQNVSYAVLTEFSFMKLELSLCLSKLYDMKVYLGNRCIDPLFIDLDTNCDKKSALRPDHFIPGKESQEPIG